jgi:hypothetical protein
VSRARGHPASQWAAVTAVALLVSGCSSGEDDTAEDPVETSSTVAAETSAAEESVEGVSLTVTFDGDTCMYDGPTELPPGEVTVTLINDSNKTTDAEMAKLQDGVTYEDVTAFHSPEPYEGARPEEDLVEPLEFDQAHAWPGDDGSTTGVVTTGEYVLVCLQVGSANALVWVARPGGVSVTE